MGNVNYLYIHGIGKFEYLAITSAHCYKQAHLVYSSDTYIYYYIQLLIHNDHEHNHHKLSMLIRCAGQIVINIAQTHALTILQYSIYDSS